LKGLVSISLLVAVLVGGIGAGVTERWLPGWGGLVIVAAGAANVGACWLAFVPVARAAKSPQRLPRAIVVSTVMRVGLVSLAALGVGVYGPWAAKVVAVWFIAYYLALLAVETGWAVRLVNRQLKGTDRSAASW
jgi:hypothetical protein